MARLVFGQAFLGRALLAACLFAGSISIAAAQTVVPPGNRSVEQPGVRGGSAKRTKAGGSTFGAKYRTVYWLLKNDGALPGKIGEAASAYGLDRLHVFGAIVG